MLSILQGETLAFTLDGDKEEFANYKVRAALYSSANFSFRRDCACGEASVAWEDIDIVEGQAVWSLTTEQSKNLAVGKYAMEVALRDINTDQDIKEGTTTIIEVKPSLTR